MELSMDWIEGIQEAIDYIEEHINEKIDYDQLAQVANSSSYHFQRVFGIVCGLTIGEYIRKRRLTLSGEELLKKKIKVIDLALKYGYDSVESFSRAFRQFHGINPSRVKNGCSLNSFSRLTLKLNKIGGNEMKYKITEVPKLTLIGYKKHFTGATYGEDRAKQESEFFKNTRHEQQLLIENSCDETTDYCVITNVNDEGYDFYIAYEFNECEADKLFCVNKDKENLIDQKKFEILEIPQSLCVVFETQKKKRPINEYIEVRQKIISDWLPSSDYIFANLPEVVAMHWRPNGDWAKERYIEIRLPIENKTKIR